MVTVGAISWATSCMLLAVGSPEPMQTGFPAGDALVEEPVVGAGGLRAFAQFGPHRGGSLLEAGSEGVELLLAVKDGSERRQPALPS